MVSEQRNEKFIIVLPDALFTVQLSLVVPGTSTERVLLFHFAIRHHNNSVFVAVEFLQLLPCCSTKLYNIVPVVSTTPTPGTKYQPGACTVLFSK